MKFHYRLGTVYTSKDAGGPVTPVGARGPACLRAWGRQAQDHCSSIKSFHSSSRITWRQLKWGCRVFFFLLSARFVYFKFSLLFGRTTQNLLLGPLATHRSERSYRKVSKVLQVLINIVCKLLSVSVYVPICPSHCLSIHPSYLPTYWSFFTSLKEDIFVSYAHVTFIKTDQVIGQKETTTDFFWT